MPDVVLLTVEGDHVPVIPFVDVVANIGAVEFWQIGAIGAKVGRRFGLTVILTVVFVAHWPAACVKVYVPDVVLLTIEGDQFPVIPFVDVVGNIGEVPPWQIELGILKLGVITGLTVILTDFGIAHCPEVGINKYVPELVLLIVLGLHVPTIPLFDVEGKFGGVDPWQIVVGKLKLGVTLFTTNINWENELAHCPVSGVKIYVPVAVLLTTAGFHVPVIPFVDKFGRTGDIPP